jgi:hypothetical protein
LAEFDDEIMLLVTEFLDGSVNAQRFRRLNELLSAYAEARTYYLEMLTIHTGLKSMMGKDAKLSDMPVRIDEPDQIPENT